jgi:hypothetical protein
VKNRRRPAILAGALAAGVFLGACGCGSGPRTHPPIDKRIRDVEKEVKKMEKETGTKNSAVPDAGGRPATPAEPSR